MKIYVYTKTCTQRFIVAALFITAKKWKQSEHPSMTEWVNKIWYVYIMQYYSAIKRSIDRCYNVLRSWQHYAKCKKPVTKGHIFYDSMKCQNGQAHRDRKQINNFPELEPGRKLGGLGCRLRDMGFLSGWWKQFKIDCDDGCTDLCIC